MTIEIQRPELEALILERMKSGAYRNIEDALMQALTSAPLPAKEAAVSPSVEADAATGAALLAAMQASPHRDIILEPTCHRLPVRDVVS